MKRLALVFAVIVSVCLPLLAAQPAAAFDPFGPARQQCPTSSTSDKPAPCGPATTDNPLTGPDGLLIKVTNALAVLGGIAAVIMIMINGIRFATSSGNAERVAGARDGVIYAVIGLIVIIIARTIIAFVLNNI